MIWLNNEKKHTTGTHNYMDESQKQNGKWKGKTKRTNFMILFTREFMNDKSNYTNMEKHISDWLQGDMVRSDWEDMKRIFLE